MSVQYWLTVCDAGSTIIQRRLKFVKLLHTSLRDAACTRGEAVALYTEPFGHGLELVIVIKPIVRTRDGLTLLQSYTKFFLIFLIYFCAEFKFEFQRECFGIFENSKSKVNFEVIYDFSTNEARKYDKD